MCTVCLMMTFKAQVVSIVNHILLVVYCDTTHQAPWRLQGCSLLFAEPKYHWPSAALSALGLEVPALVSATHSLMVCLDFFCRCCLLNVVSLAMSQLGVSLHDAYGRFWMVDDKVLSFLAPLLDEECCSLHNLPGSCHLEPLSVAVWARESSTQWCMYIIW